MILLALSQTAYRFLSTPNLANFFFCSSHTSQKLNFYTTHPHTMTFIKSLHKTDVMIRSTPLHTFSETQFLLRKRRGRVSQILNFFSPLAHPHTAHSGPPKKSDRPTYVERKTTNKWRCIRRRRARAGQQQISATLNRRKIMLDARGENLLAIKSTSELL